MVSTLVVGTDFSEGARAALATARLLAARLDGDLRVVHVFDAPGGQPPELDADARQWLEECDLDPGALITRRGTAWLELSREARSRDAAMIVVGRHGCSGFQPIELGSTAARIGLAAHCPVMLVGDRPLARSPEKAWTGSAVARPFILTSHPTG